MVATFIGRAVCATCHGDINRAFGSYNGVPFVPGMKDASHVFANFVGQAHGQDFRHKGPLDINALDGFAGACIPCHVTGFQEASGFKSSAETPHLEDISCEECHGPGSNHAGAPSSSNINRVPNAQTTCWDCHVPDYKVLRGTPPAITDASAILHDRAPGSVGFHHAQASLLVGVMGANLPVIQGPHQLVDNTCVTCHLNESTASDPVAFHGEGTLDPDFNACAPCHGSAQTAQALLADFKAEVTEKLIELGGADPSNPDVANGSPTGGLIGAFAAANGINLAANADPDNPIVQRFKAARFNYEYVETGCYVHNPPFTDALLENAKEMVTGP